MVIQLPDGLETWLQKRKWTALSAHRIKGGYAAELYQLTLQTDLAECLQVVYKSFAIGRSQELQLYTHVLPALVNQYAPMEIGRIDCENQQGLILPFAGVPLKHELNKQSVLEQKQTILRAATWLAKMHSSEEKLAEQFYNDGILNRYPIESSMQWGGEAIDALLWLNSRDLAGIQASDIQRVQEMVTWFYPLLANWMQGRFTLTHGDPHLENILVGDEGLQLIDWEFACVAVPQRDLAIFMQDILSPDLQTTAKSAFYSVLRQAGWDVDTPQFETTFHACLFDNTLMMLGWEVHKFREGHLPESELIPIVSTKLRWLDEAHSVLQNGLSTNPVG